VNEPLRSGFAAPASPRHPPPRDWRSHCSSGSRARGASSRRSNPNKDQQDQPNEARHDLRPRDRDKESGNLPHEERRIPMQKTGSGFCPMMTSGAAGALRVHAALFRDGVTEEIGHCQDGEQREADAPPFCRWETPLRRPPRVQPRPSPELLRTRSRSSTRTASRAPPPERERTRGRATTGGGCSPALRRVGDNRAGCRSRRPPARQRGSASNVVGASKRAGSPRDAGEEVECEGEQQQERALSVQQRQ
jgi:hypothetical protein